jgi:putative nucleotidyltransferase with HDIG domain
MSQAHLHLISPEPLAEFVRSGAARTALDRIASMVPALLTVDGTACRPEGAGAGAGAGASLPIAYGGQVMGELWYRDGLPDGSLEQAARAMAGLLEHMLEREVAVGDLAEEMITSYEELNMLYALLPSITARIREDEIGEALVERTAQTLACRRVSLLVLDEDRRQLKVLASRGLPSEARNAVIALSGSVSEQAMNADEVLMVDDITKCPELEHRSRGRYNSNAFAVVRVPLKARGERLGVLTATERRDGREFTARDRKLLEGLSAMGTSALLNCRLHSAVNRQMIGTIQALATAVDAKDQYTHDHSARVSLTCISTARQLGLADADRLHDVELAGLLHDIGKIGIPDAILSKPGRLTEEEFEIIKGHVHIGAEIVAKVKGLESVAKAIRHHHERYDGLGYPDGLMGDTIPLAAKLIAVADTYDSLTSDRSYHKGIGQEASVQELHKCSGTQFDPAVVDAFLAQVQADMPVACLS